MSTGIQFSEALRTGILDSGSFKDLMSGGSLYVFGTTATEFDLAVGSGGAGGAVPNVENAISDPWRLLWKTGEVLGPGLGLQFGDAVDGVANKHPDQLWAATIDNPSGRYPYFWRFTGPGGEPPEAECQKVGPSWYRLQGNMWWPNSLTNPHLDSEGTQVEPSMTHGGSSSSLFFDGQMRIVNTFRVVWPDLI